MFKNWFPQNEDFFDFFEQHVMCVGQGAQGLSAFGGESSEFENTLKSIKICELNGDEITQRCIEALHKTFITPFERTTIHSLISKLDDILDEIEDVAHCFVLYKLSSLPIEARQMIDLVVCSVSTLEIAIHELRKMKNTEEMRGHFAQLNRLEHEADRILTQALGHLFEKENDIRELIKWKEIYEHLEGITDTCEDVGDLLQGILLENE